ncbi:hypothetical protein G6M86_28100 (plasmid) [Agrobacterium tumefaciens]|uniref:Cytokinin glycosidase domain-containing protein n=1 Tax=Agrobacterium tumefaciens TaxID=358 RepID=A0AAJ4N8Y5_AGRTU|nr:hypothetical protein G6M86_28100 [Agrobacterium tumefaciens]
MTVPSWQVRDLTNCWNIGELQVRLEQARSDFRNVLTDRVYFNDDEECILSDQRLTFVYLDEATARHCALYRGLPSNSSNFGTVATEIPPWLLDAQRMNGILQERCDQGGIVNYHLGPHMSGFYLAILMSQFFIRFGTDEINRESYGFYARRGNYTEEGEDDEDRDDSQDEVEVEPNEFQSGHLIKFPIVAVGSCRCAQ